MIATVGLVARFVAYGAILCIVGAVAFRLLVLKRAGLAQTAIGRASRRAARIGVVASACLLLSALGKLALQTAEMRFPTDSWIGVGRQLLFHTSWGTVWLVQCACAALLAMSFSLARKDALPRWNTVAVLSVVLAATPAFASHAMSAQRFAQVSVLADVMHVLAASVWLGTLSVMVVSVMGSDAIDTNLEFSALQLRARYLASLLRAFSPVAVACAAVVVATGVLSSLAHIRQFAELTGTAYGQALLLKLVPVAAVLLLGWRNWKFITPGIVTSGPRPMTRSMMAEVAMTAVVVVLTAVLVVTPPPGE